MTVSEWPAAMSDTTPTNPARSKGSDRTLVRFFTVAGLTKSSSVATRTPMSAASCLSRSRVDPVDPVDDEVVDEGLVVNIANDAIGGFGAHGNTIVEVEVAFREQDRTDDFEVDGSC